MKKIVLFLFASNMLGFSIPETEVPILTTNPPPSSIGFALEECYVGYRVFITYPSGCGEVSLYDNNTNTLIDYRTISCTNPGNRQVSFLVKRCRNYNVRFSTPSMIGVPVPFTTPCGRDFPCMPN